MAKIVLMGSNGIPGEFSTESHANSGLGVQRATQKRHPKSGKPLFYTLEQWAVMSEEDRKAAGNHAVAAPVPVERIRALDEAFSTASEIERLSFFQRYIEPLVKQRLDAAAEKPAAKPAEKPAAKGDKS